MNVVTSSVNIVQFTGKLLKELLREMSQNYQNKRIYFSHVIGISETNRSGN